MALQIKKKKMVMISISESDVVTILNRLIKLKRLKVYDPDANRTKGVLFVEQRGIFFDLTTERWDARKPKGGN